MFVVVLLEAGAASKVATVVVLFVTQVATNIASGVILLVPL